MSTPRASAIAFAMAAGAPIVPPSPIPRKPPTLFSAGVSRCSTSMDGISAADGTR